MRTDVEADASTSNGNRHEGADFDATTELDGAVDVTKVKRI